MEVIPAADFECAVLVQIIAPAELLRELIPAAELPAEIIPQAVGSHPGGRSLPKLLEVNFSLPEGEQWSRGCGGQSSKLCLMAERVAIHFYDCVRDP